MASPVLRSHSAFKETPPATTTQFPPNYGAQGAYGAPAQNAPGAQCQQPQYGQPDQMERMYQAPAATPLDTGRMTYHHVITRTAGLLGLIVGVGALTWFTVPPDRKSTR